MSFIVKGIDLPEEGQRLKITVCHNGKIFIDKQIYYEEAEAIQIPKGHGRLIDEKKVENERYYIHEPYYSYPVIRWGSLHRVPTILEAEGEE